MDLCAVDRLFRRLCESDPVLKNGRTLDHGAVRTTSLSVGGSMLTVDSELNASYARRSGLEWVTWDAGCRVGSEIELKQLILQWPDGGRAARAWNF